MLGNWKRANRSRSRAIVSRFAGRLKGDLEQAFLPQLRVHMSQEKLAYMMLFCALILVRDGKATLEQLVLATPLVGKAKDLARELLPGYKTA